MDDSKDRTTVRGLRWRYMAVLVMVGGLAKGCVEHHVGFQDRGDFEKSYLSRMRATDKLISLIKDVHKVPAQAIQYYKGTETIILRDRDSEGRKVDVEYLDTATTRQMRKALTAYNALLERADITLPDAPEDGIPTSSGSRKIKIDPLDKFVRRIFNNGTPTF